MYPYVRSNGSGSVQSFRPQNQPRSRERAGNAMLTQQEETDLFGYEAEGLFQRRAAFIRAIALGCRRADAMGRLEAALRALGGGGNEPGPAPRPEAR